MLNRNFLTYIVFLAFAWFATVTYREHQAMDSAQERLREAASIAELSPSNANSDPAFARLLADSFRFSSLAFVDPQGKILEQADLPRARDEEERFLSSVGLEREIPMETELHGVRQGTLSVVWLNFNIFGHLEWLLLYGLVGGLLFFRERLREQEQSEVQSRLDAERQGRLKAENNLSELQGMEKLLAAMSSRLGSLAPSLLEDGISEAVRQLGAQSGAERSALVLLSDHGRRMGVAAGWNTREAGPGAMVGFKDMPSDTFAWTIDRLKRGEITRAPSVAKLPDEAAAERKLLLSNDVCSILIVPVTSDGELLGFLTHSQVHEEKDWSEDTIALVKLSGEMLGGAIKRMRQHEQLNIFLARHELLRQLSGAFLHLDLDSLDQGLQRALEDLGGFCHLSRVSVIQIHSDGSRISTTHEWNAAGMESLKEGSQNLPFAVVGEDLERKIMAGEAWKLDDLAFLEDDLVVEWWRQRGTRSLLVWPLLYKELSLGFLLFERAQAMSPWREEEIECARPAAELMAQLLARQRGEKALRLSEGRLRNELKERDRRDVEHERVLGNLLAVFNAGNQSLVLINKDYIVEAFNNASVPGTRMMYGKEIYAGASMLDFLPPGQYENYKRAMQRCLDGEELRHRREVRTFDGQVKRFQISYLPVFSESGGVRSVLCTYESLDELQHAEMALQESEERYALAAKGSNDGLWDWDLVKGKFYFSERWCAMAGLTPGEAPQDLESWVNMMHAEDRDTFHSRLQAHLKGQTSHFEFEYRILHGRRGDYVWVFCRGVAVREKEGDATRLAGSQTDVSLRKRAESRQEAMAFEDPLTGLPNRALFLDRVGRSLASSQRRKGYHFAVLLMDTDNFKIFNDSLGHELGDQLLIAMARRLEDLLRPGDTVGRLGGDEFAFLLEDVASSRDTLAVAARIHEELTPAFRIRDKEIFVTLSIGIVMNDEESSGAEDMLRDAETAMYQAKAMGPSRHMVFDNAMHRQAVSRMEMETELRKAIEEKHFELYYQPLVYLREKRVYGFEALLRWNHPQKGMISPSSFIPLAEETGQIVPLGQFVLEEACKQLAAWQRQGFPELTMSINLSVAQLVREELGDDISGLLKAHRLNPGTVTLEITESVLMENPAAHAVSLGELRRLGLKLAIDDFGTGYSSLSYLQRFPVDVIKIDRSFVSGIDGLEENEAISAAVLSMGRSLKLQVVAEGIENSVQRERLMHLGCLQGQGYFFDVPLPTDEAVKRLRLF